MPVVLNPRFDDATHRYTDTNGTVVPSVTELIGQYWPIDRRFYQASGTQRGTDVHILTEVMDRSSQSADDVASVAPHLRPYLVGWEQFVRDCVDGPDGFVWIEQRFLDQDRCYAGTVDRIVFDKSGYLWLLDIKTGKAESWHELQQGAYASAARRARIHVDRIMTVQLLKRSAGKNYTIHEHNLDRAMTAWDSLIKWDRYRREMKR